jgi:localization factor PodJL
MAASAASASLGISARPEMPVAAQLSTAPATGALMADMGETYAPPLDGYADEMEQPEPVRAKKPRSPQEMAQAAAAAAVRNLDPRAAGADAADLGAAPVAPLNDEPMAPGSGVPDLNAILKRVRDQKKAAQIDVATDASRKDFFSSVKRAAQAAAAEVESVGPNTAKTSPLGSVKDLYARFRRPILMVAAAAIVAIGGLQLSSALLGETPVDADLPIATGTDTSAAPAPEAALPAIAQDQPTAPADATLVPQAEGAVAEGGTPRIVGIEPEAETAAGSANTSPAITSPVPAPGTAIDLSSSDMPLATLAALVPPADFGPVALVEAAKTNDPKALFEIGRRIGENSGDPQALATAVTWMEASANQGFAPAQYRLGNMYEKGLGAPMDAAKAKIWYQMAAEQGNASAMHNLAVLYANGADGPADPESAARWFLAAAELGVADSQYNLGILSAKGQGMPQDLGEAYKWFSIIAKTGDKDAGAKRDEIAKVLRPEQLENARAKAELWKPKALDAAANDTAMPDAWRVASDTTASVDVKKAIRNVQGILNNIGYDAGPADGVMGNKTRDAVRAFQKAEKLPVTGEIDAALVKALLARNG